VPDFVSPKLAAIALGVSESSLKRWCDRGLLAAHKTAGGHRRVPVAALAQFARARGLADADLSVVGLPGPRLSAATDDARLQLQRSVCDGEAEAVEALLVARYLAGTSVAELGDELVAPVMAEVGRLWEQGSLEVYRERRACTVLLRSLHALSRLLPAPPDSAPLAVGANLSSNHYALAPTLVEMSLVDSGWRALWYGSDQPVESVAEAVRDLRPQLLWVSVSHADAPAQLVAQLAQLHAVATSQRCALLLGGRGLVEPSLRAQLDYSACVSTLREGVAFADALALALSAPV
jgi:excisionase family DNA binding protein